MTKIHHRIIALIPIATATACEAAEPEPFVLRCSGWEIGVGGELEGKKIGVYEVSYGFPASGEELYMTVWKERWAWCSTCKFERRSGEITIVDSYEFQEGSGPLFDGGSWRRTTQIGADLQFSGRYDAFKKDRGAKPIFARRFEGTCEREAVDHPPPWLLRD
ncbi:hypothetical protein [Qipengyuania sphaerica]|uniref:hypothetical protein n=1 Tax=Qipengyuania sphaerica TaxID=2867243 RepID=UPI001C86DF35|nr:hypothetical protein [Qipengyuania sphaerica]MBX7540285.1 hypothetical protein [Qipengyuania sphaerica]